MTDEKKLTLVKAAEKSDTTELKKLAVILGGADAVMEYFRGALLYHAKGDPGNLEAAAVFLIVIKRLLKRINRQDEGDQILSQILK